MTRIGLHPPHTVYSKYKYKVNIVYPLTPKHTSQCICIFNNKTVHFVSMFLIKLGTLCIMYATTVTLYLLLFCFCSKMLVCGSLKLKTNLSCHPPQTVKLGKETGRFTHGSPSINSQLCTLMFCPYSVFCHAGTLESTNQQLMGGISPNSLVAT